MDIAALPKYLKENGLKVVKCLWDGGEFVATVDDETAPGRQPWHTDEYVKYLSSEAWAKKRDQKLVYSPTCEKKSRSCRGPLQIHHRTYATLGHESMDDLETLCDYHHRQEHKAISIARYQQNKKDKAFDTWMSKRHGHEWKQWADPYLIDQEKELFDEWLDERD